MKKQDKIVLQGILLGLVLGFIFGMFMILFMFDFNIGHIQENNGFIAINNCPKPINPQPFILCSNYSMIGDYYYCNIDDVINVTNG